ncbi:hypothetical protein Tco_0018892 [Tanacetum coccineum]
MEITKDLRLAREINALCARVTAIVDEKEMFVDELDMLAGKHVPDKMAEFIKQIMWIYMDIRILRFCIALTLCESHLIKRIAYSKFSISAFLRYFWPVFASPNGVT